MEVEMLKRVALVALAIALLGVVGLGTAWLWGQVSSPAQAQTPEATSDHSPAETITVVGEGTVSIKPDIAKVSVGVETSAETVSEAVADNEAQMEAILAALKAAGIEEKDIQTTNYTIYLERYPEQPVGAESSTSEQKPVYRVSNMVTVTVRDLESVGDVLDAVIEAGANNIWGISFTLDDPKVAQADARAKAIEDAGIRAQTLADLSGVKLGPVMSVSEVIGGGSVPLAGFAVAERAASGGGTISPGELEVTYQVQMSYFIER
jgi:hypothetical protein